MDEKAIQTSSLCERKDALLADLDIFLRAAPVEHKEKNKKMKERKKKKLALQHNQPKQPSSCSASLISCETHIQDCFGYVSRETASSSAVFPIQFKVEIPTQHRGSLDKGVDPQIEIERAKLIESYTPRPTVSFDHRFIVAPMVNQSDPPFRSLCLKYGATCAYTEMLYSHRIVQSEDYLSKRLQDADHTFLMNTSAFSREEQDPNIMKDKLDDSPECCFKTKRNSTISIDYTNKNGISEDTRASYSSRPLIVQICGNDPATLSACMLRIMDHSKTCPVDAIDLNLGCPQDRAREGLYGSYLLDKHRWPLVFECVKAMTSALNSRSEIPNSDGASDENDMKVIPLFCKIRICEDGTDPYKATESFCKGKADLTTISKIASLFEGIIPIISNGNIITRFDVQNSLIEASPACGLMSAEGILADPCIFLRQSVSSCPSSHSVGVSICPDRSSLFAEYCYLSDLFSMGGGWAGLEQKDVTFDAQDCGGKCPSTDCVAEDNNHVDNDDHNTASSCINGNKVNSDYDKIITTGEISCNEPGLGKTKQLETAKQHLFWMLEKKGHGRTVRFVHLGTYKRHTDLLNEIKNANNLQELILISDICLRDVFGSEFYANDNY